MEINSSLKPDKIYTVSEVTKMVKLELESAFPLLWVEGEISNFHRHYSGHLYFTLKDEMSQLRTVMFRSWAQKVVFELKDGLQINAVVISIDDTTGTSESIQRIRRKY